MKRYDPLWFWAPLCDLKIQPELLPVGKWSSTDIPRASVLL